MESANETHGAGEDFTGVSAVIIECNNAKDFPGGSDSKEFACDAGYLGSILGSGRSPGEENGYPFQYSCLENSMDRGAWRAQ